MVDAKEKLGFVWTAEFSGGKIVDQFDKDGKEARFKEVLDNEGSLVRFSVISTDSDEIYTCDLENKKLIGPTGEVGLTGSDPQLVYFRRNSVRLEIGTGKGLEPKVVHHLGMKTTTQEQQFEIFKGQEMRPKEIKLTNVKTNEKVDLTEEIKKEIVAK